MAGFRSRVADVLSAIKGSTIEPQSVTTDDVAIKNISAELEKTTDQPLSANTNVTVSWDSQDVDTELYSYDGQSDTIEVLEDGDYLVAFAIHTIGITNNQSKHQLKIDVNGAPKAELVYFSTGTINQSFLATRQFKGLSANDTLSFAVRCDEDNDLLGQERFTYATITRSG